MSNTSIRFALLGMVKLRPMSGYEIKQAYLKGPANFMPISFGQIYPVLTKLEKVGLVRHHRREGGRGSIRYSITPKGDETLREWIYASGNAATYRELLLRLFFAEPGELAGLIGQVEAFRKEEQAELYHYDETGKWLDEVQGNNPQLPIWKLIMEYGVMQSQSHIRWAEKALAFMASRSRKKK
jgi:PadR family transcriptional regulator AphA